VDDTKIIQPCGSRGSEGGERSNPVIKKSGASVFDNYIYTKFDDDLGGRKKRNQKLTDWAVALVFILVDDAASSVVLAGRGVTGFEHGVTVLTCPARVTDTSETNKEYHLETCHKSDDKNS